MYKIILPIRYLLKRRISYFSVAAVALCVFVVLVVITVLSGLTSEFKQRTHDTVGDCVVSSRSMVGFTYYEEFVKTLNQMDFIEAVSPVIKSYAFVNQEIGDRQYGSWTVQIMGIDPVLHDRVTGFSDWLNFKKENPAEAFQLRDAPELPGCVPGAYVLNRQWRDHLYRDGQSPRLKFEISCFPLTAKGALAKAGAGMLNTKTFYYSDHATSGLFKLDRNIIYLPLSQARMLCGMAGEHKRISAIHIKFKPGVEPEVGSEKVKLLWDDFTKQKADAPYANLLENVRVQSWKTYSRIFIAAMETEQTMMIIVFGLIGIITVFVVFVVFYMIVSHKSKDFGILKSIGVSRLNIMLVFLNFAFLVAASGSFLGALAGWRFLAHINQIEAWLFEHFQFQLWDRSIYPTISDIPNTIDLKVLAAIIFSAVVACLAGALIPSWQAAKYEPVETLQVSQL